MLIGSGTAVAGLGFALVSMVGVGSTVLVVMAAYTVLTFGTGMVAPLAIDLVVSTAPPERAGAASALGETSAEFGGAVGIAALGTVAAAVYRSRLADTAPPGLTVDDGATLGAALSSAPSLPDPAAAIAAAARAFVDGFTSAAALAAVLLLALAALVTIRLWTVPPAGTAR